MLFNSPIDWRVKHKSAKSHYMTKNLIYFVRKRRKKCTQYVWAISCHLKSFTFIIKNQFLTFRCPFRFCTYVPKLFPKCHLPFLGSIALRSITHCWSQAQACILRYESRPFSVNLSHGLGFESSSETVPRKSNNL